MIYRPHILRSPFQPQLWKLMNLFLVLIFWNTHFCVPLWAQLMRFAGLLEDPFKLASEENFPFTPESFECTAYFSETDSVLSISASPICQMLNSWTDLIQDFPNMCCCDKIPQQKQLQRGFPLAQSSSYLQRSGGDEYLCIHLVFYILCSPENGAAHFYGRSSNLSSGSG